MKIQLKGRAIPRNASGDPAFRFLEETDEDAASYNGPTVLNVFTEQEVVELVNRALYQLEYQHEAHKTRGKRVREEERAIRLKVKELFHVSWMKATPEQVKRAREEVEKA
jgi:hypothetical protein